MKGLVFKAVFVIVLILMGIFLVIKLPFHTRE